MKSQFLIILLSVFSVQTFAQNIYTTKLEGCVTERFALEGDSITAKKSKEYLSELVYNNIDPNTRDKVRGILKIQIIAYEDKSSCMMSYENSTNTDDESLNIKNLKILIDQELVWDEVPKAVSPMIEFYFMIDNIVVKRMGLNGKKGIHELTD